MNDPSGSLIQVDIRLADASITGFLHSTGQNRRLVDILNAQDEVVEVASAALGLAGSPAPPRTAASLLVGKRHILLAIPRETPEQVRQRRLSRTGISPVVASQTQLGFLLPGLYIQGTVRVPAALARNRIDPTYFDRFFAVTEADITRIDGQALEEEVVIVHRDAISAFVRPDA